MSTQRETRTRELEDQLDTFTSAGFKKYHEDCLGLHNALTQSAVADCGTGEAWLERRGRLLMLTEIINYPQAAMVELQNIDDAEFTDEQGGSPPNSLEE